MRLIIATIGHWKAGNQLAPEQLLYERYADRIRTSLELREIEANQGHDAFLMPIPQYLDVLKNFMDNIN